MNVIALDDEKDVKVLYEYFFSSEVESGKIKLDFFHNPLHLLENVQASKAETLLLTDMKMPDLSGTDVVDRLLLKLPNLRVFVISALELRLPPSELNRLKIERVYSKPLNFSKLREDVLGLL